MNQPDKIFRDKLHNYEKPVSPQAWERIAVRVTVTTRRVVWLKTAAAILLLALAGTFLFTMRFNDSQDTIATTTGSDNQEMPRVNDSVEEPIAHRMNEKNPDSLRRNVPSIATVEKKVERPGRRRQPALPPEVKTAVVKATDLQAVKPTEEVIGRSEIFPESNSESTATTNVIIVFDASEVNKKYFTKKDPLDATPEKKESSTLKKVLDKAYDLTHNQDPIGNLRQKKNEILALNFKNDKQRNEPN